MLQVAEEVLRDPQDTTQVNLIFANQTTDDILLKKEIDALAKKHANFNVFYVVDKAPLGGLMWKGGVGYITEEMLKEHMPPPGDDGLVLVRPLPLCVRPAWTPECVGCPGCTW